MRPKSKEGIVERRYCLEKKEILDLQREKSNRCESDQALQSVDKLETRRHVSRKRYHV